MKKTFFPMCSLLFLVLLMTACSADEKAELEDIYQQTLAASEELENFEMEAKVNQQMEGGGIEIPPISTTINAKIQLEPLAFYQTMDVIGQEVEMYYTEEGMFFKDPQQGQWMKGPKELMDQLNLATVQQQQNPSGQLKQLEKYAEDFSIEETDNRYILSLSASGEGFDQLLKEQLNSLPEGEITAEVFDNMKINKLDYTITVSKDTYYPEAMTVDMDLDIEENGTTTNLSQKMESTYRNFNELDKIEIPKEVTDTAVEMENPM
ncbi:DUF6612 family protein [Sediminibacillus halophilus]|uniref:Outer membrane lipoprotein-sorting protein n=1 Tax=Sediminibacillus halophilus TaxID=482461 RepID=A0A1G9QNS5_9BACI|nr:DUF6612 family protein [Sediminibacillus halophilus]SDM12530.1 hypothetical protein SAMN05216244_1587 [Sediminibacillus halophilus]